MPELTNQTLIDILVEKKLASIGMIMTFQPAEIASEMVAIFDNLNTLIDNPKFPVNSAMDGLILDCTLSAIVCWTRLDQTILSNNYDSFIKLCETLLKYPENLAQPSHPHNNALKNLLLIHSSTGHLENLTGNKTLFPIFMKLAEVSKDPDTQSSLADAIRNCGEVTPKTVSPYADTLITLMGNAPGRAKMLYLMALKSIFSLNPEPFLKNVDIFVKNFAKGDSSIQMQAVMILMDIGKAKPSILEPHIPTIAEFLESKMLALMIFNLFSIVAEAIPKSFEPLLQVVKDAVKEDPNATIFGVKIVRAVGEINEERAKECIAWIVDRILTGDVNYVATSALELQSIMVKYRAALEPYIETLQSFAKSLSNEGARNSLQGLFDAFEGRTMEKLATVVSAQEIKVDGVVQDQTQIKTRVDVAEQKIDSLEQQIKDVNNFVQANIDELKEFMATIVKKLPVPMDFTSEDRYLKMQKVLNLHFKCACNGEYCQFKKSTFTTQTKVVSKWIKVAFTALSVGFKLWEKDLSGALEGIRGIYEASKGQYDDNFVTFITQPFLTSQEQDELILQLREAKYFDSFEYDAKKGDWVCHNCKNPEKMAELAAAKIALEEEAAKAKEADAEKAAKAKEADAEKAAKAALDAEKVLTASIAQASATENDSNSVPPTSSTVTSAKVTDSVAPPSAPSAALSSSSSNSTEKPTILKSGTFFKRGGKLFLKKWQKRVFEVRSNDILSYREQSAITSSGEIPFKAIRNVAKVSEREAGRANCLSIATEKKVYLIHIEDNDEFKDWLDYLTNIFRSSHVAA